MTENNANREYKDNVFVALCEDKERIVEIYNAVSGKNYPADAALEIVTLKDVLFMGRRNDVAFLLEDRLIVLMEHQSTVCENMPARLLMYIGGVACRLRAETGKNS
jgi:regulator of sigma D